jgi:hypothetical protein
MPRSIMVEYFDDCAVMGYLAGFSLLVGERGAIFLRSSRFCRRVVGCLRSSNVIIIVLNKYDINSLIGF